MVEGLKMKVPEFEKPSAKEHSDIIDPSRKKTSPVLIEEYCIQVNM
jgi:hypothetical protein